MVRLNPYFLLLCFSQTRKRSQGGRGGEGQQIPEFAHPAPSGHQPFLPRHAVFGSTGANLASTREYGRRGELGGQLWGGLPHVQKQMDQGLTRQGERIAFKVAVGGGERGGWTTLSGCCSCQLNRRRWRTPPLGKSIKTFQELEVQFKLPRLRNGSTSEEKQAGNFYRRGETD